LSHRATKFGFLKLTSRATEAKLYITKGHAMSINKAVESKNKSAKIYLTLGLIFVGIFSTITILYYFVAALNF